MRFLFIHPSGGKAWKAKQRYTVCKRTLHHRYNIESNLIESSTFRGKTSDTNMLCNDVDVIVLHIQACKDASQMIQHWKARDKIVIVDIPVPVVLDASNNRFLIGTSAVSHFGSLVDQTTFIDQDQLIWIVKLSDAVIVNSRQLLEDWSGICKVFYLPDFVDMDKYLIHPYEAHDGIHLGIRVSDGSVEKLKESGLLSALDQISGRYPHTRMLFYGVHPDRSGEINLPLQQKEMISVDEPAKWMAVLPSLDIGILPKMSAFDQRSGREEILEFMMMKVPWVASTSRSNRELGQYGWLVQNNPGTWERILDDMVTNLDTYRTESSEGFLFALGQGIDENIDKFLSACYSIRTDIFTGVV